MRTLIIEGYRKRLPKNYFCNIHRPYCSGPEAVNFWRYYKDNNLYNMIVTNQDNINVFYYINSNKIKRQYEDFEIVDSFFDNPSYENKIPNIFNDLL